MTVSIPEFDEQLHGHSAVQLDGVCHAIVSDYDGEFREDATECGLNLSTHRSRLDTGTRKDFVDEGSRMCRECWPSDIDE